MEEFDFSSKEELYKRIRPALAAKVAELQRLGYAYIQEVDIWNYLIVSKWKYAKNLMLSDVVHDILHADNQELDIFLKGKIAKEKRRAYFQQDLEIV